MRKRTPPPKNVPTVVRQIQARGVTTSMAIAEVLKVRGLRPPWADPGATAKSRAPLFPKPAWRTCPRIEQAAGNRPRVGHLGMRCGKTAESHAAPVGFACILIGTGSAHMAGNDGNHHVMPTIHSERDHRSFHLTFFGRPNLDLLLHIGVCRLSAEFVVIGKIRKRFRYPRHVPIRRQLDPDHGGQKRLGRRGP